MVLDQFGIEILLVHSIWCTHNNMDFRLINTLITFEFVSKFHLDLQIMIFFNQVLEHLINCFYLILSV